MSKNHQQVNLRIIEVIGLPGRVTAILVEDEVCAVSSMADGSSTKIMFPEEVFSAVASAVVAGMYKIVADGTGEAIDLGDSVDDVVKTTNMIVKYSDLRSAGLVSSIGSITWTNGQAIIDMSRER